MTLGAFKPGTEEYPNGVGHIVQRHSCIPKIVSRGRVVENQSVTAYQLSDEFVIGSIDSNLVFDPFSVEQRIVDPGGYAQKVCPKLVRVCSVTGIVRE